jgi:hypothetical protein
MCSLSFACTNSPPWTLNSQTYRKNKTPVCHDADRGFSVLDFLTIAAYGIAAIEFVNKVLTYFVL